MNGVWRDGELLVVSKEGAVFPDVCIFTNQPVTSERTSIRIVANKTSGWETSALMGVKPVAYRVAQTLRLWTAAAGLQTRSRESEGRIGAANVGPDNHSASCVRR